MKALVTGGSGFIGGHLVKNLLTRGDEVVCIVRDLEKSMYFKELGAELFEGDISKYNTMSSAFDGVDTVFHLAAKVQDYGPWSDFYSSTVLGTENVMKASIRGNVKRVIYLSSLGSYDRKFTLGTDIITEKDWSERPNLRKMDPYCRAKRLAEEMVWRCKLPHKLDCTVIRSGTVYGSDDKPMFFKLAQALDNREFYWINEFNPVVGMIHVNDLVRLCLLAADNPTAAGQAYNAGPAEPVHLRQFIELVCKELDTEIPTKKLPFSLAYALGATLEFVSSHILTNVEPALTRLLVLFLSKGNQRCSIKKAMEELGWVPEVPLTVGVRAAAKSYLDYVDR